MITEIKIAYNSEQEFYFVLDKPVENEEDIDIEKGKIEVRKNGEILHSTKISEMDGQLDILGKAFTTITNGYSELANLLKIGSKLTAPSMTLLGGTTDFAFAFTSEKLAGRNNHDARITAISNAITSYTIHDIGKRISTKLAALFLEKVSVAWLGAFAEPTFWGEVGAILFTLYGPAEIIVNEISNTLNGITEISLDGKSINWIKNDTENKLDGNIEDIAYFWDNGLKNFSELKTLEGYYGGNSRLRIDLVNNFTKIIQAQSDIQNPLNLLVEKYRENFRELYANNALTIVNTNFPDSTEVPPIATYKLFKLDSIKEIALERGFNLNDDIDWENFLKANGELDKFKYASGNEFGRFDSKERDFVILSQNEVSNYSLTSVQLEDLLLPFIGNDEINIIKGSDKSNTLIGNGGNDLINGGEGNDILYGGTENDTFYFKTGDGYDTIKDIENNDKVSINNNVVEGDIYYLKHQSGNLAASSELYQDIHGNQYIYETNINRLSISYGSNDPKDVIVLENFEDGKAGIKLNKDTFSYYYGGWEDGISGLKSKLLTTGVNDNLIMGADLDALATGDILNIPQPLFNIDKIDSLTDELTNAQISYYEDQYFGNTAKYHNGSYGNGQVLIQKAFFDKYVVEKNNLSPTDVVLGKKSGETLNGTSNGEILISFDGGDTINAGAGNDVLFGDSGNDTLDGGADADTYIFKTGHGDDIIVDDDGTIVIDNHTVGKGIYYKGSESGQFSKTYYDGEGNKFTHHLSTSTLIINYGTSDSITINNFENDTFGIKLMEDSDGDGILDIYENKDILQDFDKDGTPDYLDTDDDNDGKLTIEELNEDVKDGNPYDAKASEGKPDYLDGEDTIIGRGDLYGGAWDDDITGSSQGDRIYGGSGHDDLRGAGGSDILRGGTGVDTYIFNTGDGRDTIFDTGGVIKINGSYISGEAKLEVDEEGNSLGKYVLDGLTLRLVGDTLNISYGNSDLVLVRDFENGKMGITLSDSEEVPPIIPPIEPPITPTDPEDGDDDGDSTGTGGTGGGGTGGDDEDSPWGPGGHNGGDPLDPELKRRVGETYEEWMERIRKLFQQAEQTKSPIILDLNSDGIKTTSLENGVNFDHDNNDFAEKTAWISSSDGLLVNDIDSNGIIDNGTELFGDNTILLNGTKAANGFEALKEFDENDDNIVDENDENFDQLKIWQDINSNGITDIGELKSLSEIGIKSLSTNYIESDIIDDNGNTHKQLGSFTKTDGTTSDMNDVWFQTDDMLSEYIGDVEISDDIKLLPNLKGFGYVADLHQAMAMDESNHLEELIEQFSNEADEYTRRQLTIDIIYTWTEVTDIDPDSRAANYFYGNAIEDARKLEALEEFLGEEYIGAWCWNSTTSNPHALAVPKLLEAFDKLSASIYYQLMVQTHLKKLYNKIIFVWDEEETKIKMDLSGVATEILSLISADKPAGLILLEQFVINLQDLKFIEMSYFEAFKEIFTSISDEYDLFIETAGKIRIFGTSDDDLIHSGSRADIIQGGAGNDNIWTDTENDTITGGLGNDYLQGGRGDDTYIFNRRDGQDTIYDAYGHKDSSYKWINTNNSYLAGNDTLKFGEGITKEDLIIKQDVNHNGNHLMVGLKEEGVAFEDLSDKITIVNFKYLGMRIESFEFNDGTKLDVNEILSLLISDEADAINWTTNAMNISTLDGDDNVITGNFDDTVDLGLGNDSIYSEGGADTITGGAGNDLIYSGSGADSITGGAGNDNIWTDTGNDTITGGLGNDYLQGGREDDTYIFNRGDGQDTIYDAYEHKDSSDKWKNTNNSYLAGNDTLKFGEGITKEDLIIKQDVSHNGNHLMVGLKEEGVAFEDLSDKITIVNFKYLGMRIESFEFNDGTKLDVNEILSLLISDEADAINWTTNAMNISTLDGDDNVVTGNFNDTVDLGLGNDSIYSEGGADTIIGGLGNDTIDAGEGNNTVHGNQGNDDIVCGHDNDILVGGEGNDHLQGKMGDDTYIFNKGDGQDIIYDAAYIKGGGGEHMNSASYSTTYHAGNDTLKFGEGITKDNLHIEKDGNNLIVGLKEEGKTFEELSDKITIEEFFDNNMTIETFEFSDGSKLESIEIFSLFGSEDADTITWTDTAITISTLGGNDTITTGSHADIINSGDGDDNVYSGEGNDLIYAGTGNDSIQAWHGNNTVHGNQGDDSLGSGYGNDTIYGDEGNDFIHTSLGNDTIIGGTGNDTLEGSGGNDTYIFNKGDGQDLISDRWDKYSTHDNYNNAGIDTLKFGSGITKENLIIKQLENDLVVGLKEEGKTFEELSDKITIKDFTHVNARIEYFEFDDGTKLNIPLFGSEDTDTINWTDTAVNISTLGGNDTITTGSHADIINSGDGDDNVYSGEGNDLIYAGTGNDSIQAWHGNNTVHGNQGDDSLGSGYGNDTIYGDEGNDFIHTSLGNDTIIGGTGNDTLEGSGGNDTYIFNKGDGQDLISDRWDKYSTHDNYNNAGIDTLKFGSGITKENLIIKQLENDLVVGLKEEGKTFEELSDKITIKDFTHVNARIEYFEFDDGTKLNIPLFGSEDTDTINWTDTAVNISTLGGNDTITTGSHADIINSGDGDDNVYSGEGNDLIYAGTGNDSIQAWHGNNTVHGNQGDDSLGSGYGNDTIYGDEGNDFIHTSLGNDTIIGGTGNDTLEGSGGNDTYIFNKGDGQDLISDRWDKYSTHDNYNNAGIDTLKFGSGITKENLIIKQLENDLVVGLKEEGKTFEELSDKITIKDFTHVNARIEYFEFSDGTTLNTNNLFVTATSNDTITANANDNLIFTNEGNDTITAGLGNDLINGGAGDDTYVFNSGDGQDIIFDESGNDKLVTNINPLDIIFNKSDDTLEMLINGSDDKITINDWDSNGTIEEISVSDDQFILSDKVDELIQAMSTFSAQNEGISWETALEEKKDEVDLLVSSYYQQK